MPSTEKTPLHAQVKLLAVCLLAELALCGMANAVRLHVMPLTREMDGHLSQLTHLWLTCSFIAMNIVSMAAAVAAIVKKWEYRRFAIVSLPLTLAATVLIAATCFLGGAQSSAAVAFAAYLLALGVYRFVPGKIWPPESLK